MTFRLRHEWREGAVVNGSKLSSCKHCETTRVHHLASGKVHFLRAVAEKFAHMDRVFEREPPCVSPRIQHMPFRAVPVSTKELAKRLRTESGSLTPGQVCVECQRKYGEPDPCEVCDWKDHDTLTT